MAVPVMYFQSSNYIVEPGVFTRTTQKGIYQMQFNPSNNTFHLYLQDIFVDPQSKQKDKNIVRKDKDLVENIIKEFKESSDKLPPSSPQGVQNDRVSFFVFAMH